MFVFGTLTTKGFKSEERVVEKCRKTSTPLNRLQYYSSDSNGVKKEFEYWFNKQYGDKSLKERQALGAFYTPPELSVQMVEKLGVSIGNTLLDPTVGAGGLLAAAIILGKVNPDDCYGIELDPETANIARNRLDELGVPPYNIRVGDALNRSSYNFQKPTSSKEETQLMGKLGIDSNGWISLRFKNKNK